MPRLSRKESQALTRERLLDSARQAFARDGFAATSVEEIADGAGYSKGGFYSNFPSKEAILLEVLRGHMEQEVAEIRGVVEQASDQHTLRQRLETWMRSFHRDADWSMLAIELALYARREPAFAKAYDTVQAAHQRALGEVMALVFTKAGKRLPADAIHVATLLKALVYGLALQDRPQTTPDGRPNPVELAELMMKSLLKAAEKADSK